MCVLPMKVERTRIFGEETVRNTDESRIYVYMTIKRHRDR